MKQVLFTLLCICCFLPGFTQVRIGPELGLNCSNYAVKELDYMGISPDPIVAATKMKVGLRVGAVIDMRFADHFYFQPAALYVMNGYKISDDIYTNTFSINTLTIPFNFLIKTGRPGGNRFFFGCGPYVGFNLSGHITFGDGTPGMDIKIGPDKNADIIRTTDYGVGANGGYELANGLLFRVHCQFGFQNLYTYTDDGVSMKNYNYGISAAYLFGGKKHSHGSRF